MRLTATRLFTLFALALTFWALPGASSRPVLYADQPPNFVIIYADDLGYADIGPFGCQNHRTPHLDRMAREGRIFTNFYVTSGVCSPSRSSLMTGCYPRRVNLHQNEQQAWVLFPGNKRGLNPSERTIAEVLKEKEYATAIIGKWHLGDQPAFLPTRQGFDSYFGIPYSNDMGHDSRPEPYRYPPLPLLRDEQVIEEEPDQRYLTRRYTEAAIAFINQNATRPFFLYLPHTMPHWPQYASENFAGKSANGKWGDAVEEIDWSTGQILDAIRRAGIEQRTLVIFTSDNGGAIHHGASNAPLKGGKGTTWEGGHRVCNVMWWPQSIPAGTRCDELATTMDMLPTLAGLAGVEVPEDHVIDGKNIWPLMTGQAGAKSPHDRYYYYFRGDLHAVRSGPWKMFVQQRPPRRQPGKPAPEPFATDQRPVLYNLDEDISETKDVAAQHPEVIQRLMQYVREARTDLGDGQQTGSGQRAPGHVEDAVPLTSN
jgi:arylsulfatase A-like enzyme